MLLTLFLMAVLGVVLGGVWVGVSTLVGIVRTRVPLVHSSVSHAAQVFEQVGFSDATVFYELGSGNGRIVFLAERMGAGRVVGFELVSWVYIVSRLRVLLRGSGARFFQRDFMRVNWAGATVVYAYLLPDCMQVVEEKFLRECRPGAVLISQDFQLPTLVPERVVQFEHPHCALVYVHP